MISVGASAQINEIISLGNAGFLKYPVELVFPENVYDISTLQKEIECLKSLKKEGLIDIVCARTSDISISGPKFREWGLEIVKVLEYLEIPTITFRPNILHEKNAELVESIVENIREVDRSTEVNVFIESFDDYRRILTIRDLLENKIPFSINISELVGFSRVFRLLALRHSIIEIIYFSLKEENKSDKIFSVYKEILKYLKFSNWSGNIIINEGSGVLCEDLDFLKGVLYDC